MSKNFQALLDAMNGVASEAEDLNKSMAAEDAGAGADANAAPGGEATDATDEDDEAIAAAAAAAEAGGEGGETLGKSFEVVGADGTKHQAVDATDMLKSLLERTDAAESNLAKALETFTGVVQKQGELIKSLTAKVADLSKQGRGRKTMVTISEKPDAATMTKSEGADAGMNIDQFMAKANTAFDQGKITGRELTVIDVCRRQNQPIDPPLIQKVISA